ncbi:hypothetical protein CEQ21_14985 [Niallia circulans]|uniref:SGNH hydrolase-type esterase domain-containing protein n=1 Tax=Niallia circulans TaxID=1397 RepID=A0A553SIJ7_NIACI|nr:GDSL-type esterase/lipase family protein [Niallia circulans]TRZ36814.1 hypothetical protein CEQ21_14985 [Niallia circulans]
MKVNKTLWILVLFIALVFVIYFGINFQAFKSKEITAMSIKIEEINNERTYKDRLVDEKIKWINEYLKKGNIEQPEKEMTEAEFFVLLSKIYGVSPILTDSSEYWAAGYYQMAVEKYEYNTLDVKQSNEKISYLRAAEIVNMILGEKNKGILSFNFLIQNGYKELFGEKNSKLAVSRKEGISIILRTKELGFYTFQKVNKNSKKSFVFLGDSISLGWNADNNTTKNKPTNYGFPYLIGNQNEDYHITNLASSGAYTKTLLTKLNNPIYQTKIKKADLICIDIGSVDLLESAREYLEKVKNGGALPTAKQVINIKDAAKLAMNNIDSIIKEIRIYTDSPIYLIGLYNPIPSGTVGADFGDSIIKEMNKYSVRITKDYSSVIYVDSFSTFKGKETKYVIDGEIHPTYEGQKVIAYLLSQKLPKQ